MSFTSEQIKQLDNPYQELKTAKLLAEHQTELDKLSPEEMNDVATKMLLACPKEEMQQFADAFAGLKQSESEFFAVLYNAHETTMRIIALLDPEHSTPHSLLSGKEFNQDRFNEFDVLTRGLLKGNEVSLAIRLALTTPAEVRSSVASNLAKVFPGSECAQKVGAAFNLCRQIEGSLLKDQPQKFFTSRDYNPDLCREFSPLLSALLKGNEQRIGQQLSLLERKEISQICRELEQLNTVAHDRENPFRLIVAAITIPPVETQQTITRSEGGVRNRFHQFHNAASSKDEASAPTIVPELKTETEDCTFCGLFQW